MGSFVIDPHAKPRYTYEEMCEIAKIELENLKISATKNTTKILT